jgi:diketogulonate reductase-like aldo/keto reductase
MTSLIRAVALRGGDTIPAVGLGVYQSAPGEECYRAVLTGLQLGYRHIDTAQIYQNEADVGRAIVDSKVPRNEIFITTKLWIQNFGFEKALAAVDVSLAKLQTSYVNLLLLHAPGEPSVRAETWRALEQLQRSGKVRNIGVSNFGAAHLARLAETAEIQPAVNQIEVHPWLQRKELVQYCQRHGIVVQAYSPLAKAAKLGDPVVGGIAARLGITAAQVLIAWSLQKNLVTLPKSVHAERQALNLAAHDISLPEEDIAKLDTLEEYFTTGWDPIKTSAV